MALQTQIEQSQKLVPTQAMQQALNCLQIPVGELESYLQEQALSNPFLELEDSSIASVEAKKYDIKYREREKWIVHSADEEKDFFGNFSVPDTYTDYLNEQLGCMNELDGDMLLACRYIVGNLNSAGYLDCSLEEMSNHLGLPLFLMEQALFVVQDLDPPGTAARSLSECLVLQLAKSEDFSEATLHLAKSGLELLANMDFSGLAKLLGISVEAAKHAAKTICRLNPVPSRGFYAEEPCTVIIPEAEIRCENGKILVETNPSAMPKLSLNQYYCSLVGNRDYQDAQAYLKERLNNAKAVISSVDERISTIYRLLTNIVMMQPDFFLNGADLQPMTMQQLAERMDMNVSTVSRAIKDKYIIHNGRLLSVRSLFTSSVHSVDGEIVSSESAKSNLLRLINAEDARKPLTDRALSIALEDAGIIISRRTVTKYRKVLGIPAAYERKKQIDTA